MKLILTLFIIFVALFGSVTLSQDVPLWSFCDGKNVTTYFNIHQLTATPDPPVIGKEVVVVLNGTVEQTVTGGSSSFNLQYDMEGRWINLPEFQSDICSMKGISCPINAGPLNFQTSVNVPIITPPGSYRGSLVLTSSSGDQIACLVFNTTMGYSF